MKEYLFLFIAVVLLAVDFSLQKLYQQKQSASVKSGLIFNAICAAFGAVFFFLMNGCTVSLTPFSMLMAGAMALLMMLYTLLGFRIMREGNMALYTLALMAGGMTVPYLFGLVFLHEEVSLLRVIGLIVILAAVVLSHSDGAKASRKQLLLCVVVFFLNGGCSIVSKLHQIEAALPVVSATAFVLLNNFGKLIFASAALPFAVRNTEKQRVGWKILLLIAASAVVSGLSYRLQLIGAETLPASVLYPFLTGGSIVLSSLSGVIFFKEKLSKRTIIGVIVCFVGTCLFLFL